MNQETIELITRELTALGAEPDCVSSTTESDLLHGLLPNEVVFEPFRLFYQHVNGCKQPFGDADWKLWSVSDFRLVREGAKEVLLFSDALTDAPTFGLCLVGAHKGKVLNETYGSEVGLGFEEFLRRVITDPHDPLIEW